MVLTSGLAGLPPRVNGDAITNGNRKPSSVLPLTISGSIEFAAVARGGATCSKNPPHSSKLMTSIVFAQPGPLATASNTEYRNCSPRRISACGWSSSPVPSSSTVSAGSRNDTAGSVPLAASDRKLGNSLEILKYFVAHSAVYGTLL